MRFLGDCVKAYYNKVFVPRYPIGITLYVNNFCNLKCGFCEIGIYSKERGTARARELSRDEIDSVVRLSRERRIGRIIITGGEPFLAKNLWYLLESCKGAGITVENITTNGTLLAGLDRYRIGLLNDVVRDIIVSIDSADAGEHDRSRGIDGVFREIDGFMREKRKTAGFMSRFAFNVVVHNSNVKGLEKIVDLAASWGIGHINFQPVSTESIFPDMDKITNKDDYSARFGTDDYIRTVEAVEVYAETKGVSTNAAVFKLWTPYYFTYLSSEEMFFKKMPMAFTCSKIYNYIHVNYNGDLIPCANLKPFANIKDGDVFKRWQEHGQDLKKALRRGEYPRMCRFCFCDFPANFRFSLIYSPLGNIRFLWKAFGYYLKRIREKKG